MKEYRKMVLTGIILCLVILQATGIFTITQAIEQNNNKIPARKIPQLFYNRIPTNIPISENTSEDYWNIIVPDDCMTITDALRNASAGDRIFVRSGTYYEHLYIDIEMITLTGENRNTTIIRGNRNNHIIDINESADGVNISDFTIKNSNKAGIYLTSNGNICKNITIENTNIGIKCNEANGNHLISNTIRKNQKGIYFGKNSHGNNITANSIYNNSHCGIEIQDTCTINSFKRNNISYNIEYGIIINNNCRSNLFINNTIAYQKKGIEILNFSHGNIFYLNYFLNNTINAFDSCFDEWDNGNVGNYWSDYTGNDTNHDGIGDQPKYIDGGENIDRFPIIKQGYVSFPIDDSCQWKNSYYEQKVRSSKHIVKNIIRENTTIQQIIDNASEGDTVFIPPGHYYEHFEVNKSLRITPSQYEKPTIIDGSHLQNHIISIRSDNVEICGFIIQNSNPAFSGIRIYGDNCLIHGNELRNCGDAIGLWNTRNTTIANNQLYNSIWGIYSHKSHDCIILSNYFENTSCGIECGFSTIDIQNNRIESFIFQAILFINTLNSSLYNNYIDGNRIGMDGHNGFQLFNSNNINIRENTVISSYFSGISIHCSNRIKINENELKKNRLCGISLWFNSRENMVENNTLDKNNFGIYTQLSSDNTIQHNILEGTESHSSMWTGIGIFINLFSHNNTVNNNTITHYEEALRIQLMSNNNIIKQNTIIGLDSEKYEADGIVIFFYSDNNKITQNHVSQSDNGIYLYYANYNQIYENIIEHNDYGIYITQSDANTLSNNSISRNTYDGIKCINSRKDVICYNSIKTNYDNGIECEDTSYLTIMGNFIFDNDNGIEISGTLPHHYTITQNIILGNTNHGIYIIDEKIISYLFSLKISENTIGYNKYHGLFCKACFVTISNNTFLHNDDGGLFLKTCIFAHINKNNFMKNTEQHATFLNSKAIIFKENYWDDWTKAGPYDISGIQFSFIPWLKFDLLPSLDPHPYDFSLPEVCLEKTILCDRVEGYGNHGEPRLNFTVGETIYSYSEMSTVIRGVPIRWDWKLENQTIYRSIYYFIYSGNVAVWNDWTPHRNGTYSIDIYYNDEYIGSSDTFTVAK